MKKTKSIKQVSTFAELSEKERNTLYGLAAIKTLKKGEYLIREGETDQTLYVVLEGEVKITKVVQGRITEIAALHEGDWIGEIAFTKRTPRTASVLAWTPARVMAINKPTLNALPPETQLFFFRRMSDLANDR
ncbi:MAG: cyclic nucleotide-binding domain-containing protein, partial [Thermodesulfobacteriota bacterium]|nr:cyclic nucleotide-binding domain-containing protein [Thermodesulfobacteriota bacterium]